MAQFVPKILRHLKNVAFGGITETNGQDAINGLETRKLATDGDGSALSGQRRN